MQVYLEEFGKTIGFPDDFSQDQIKNAIKSNIIPQLRREEEEKRQEEIQKKRDEVGILGALPRGLSRGFTQTAGLIGDVLPAMVGQAIGADEYRDKQMQEYLDRMQKMEEERPSLVPSYKDIDSIGDVAKYGLETVGQFIPSVATSIAGGGIGGFIGQSVAKKGAQKLAGEAAERFAKKAVTTGQIGGAFAGSGIQTIPEAYATLEEETGDPKLGTSLIVGGVNAALDSILPAAFLTRLGKVGREEVSKNIVAKTLQNLGSTTAKTRKGAIAKGALKSGVVEGLTEGTQEFNQLTAARILDENPEFWESGDFERILDSSIRGAVGGKAFGALSGAMSQTEEQRTKREQAIKDNELQTALDIVKKGVDVDPILQIELGLETGEKGSPLKSPSAIINELKKNKDLPKPIVNILNNKSLTPKERITRVQSLQAKLKEQLNAETKFDKEQEKTNKEFNVEVNKKEVRLEDERPTDYRVVNNRGKSQNVPPFADLEEAKAYVQSQEKPEKLKLQNQLGDEVYSGIATKDLPPPPLSEKETDTKTILENRKKILLGQPIGKKVVLSSKDAQRLLLTGQLKESSYYEASERGAGVEKKFDDEVEDVSAESPVISKESTEYINAVETINKRIESIEEQGEQGKKTAFALREILSDNERTVGELITAFEVADIMTQILPEATGHAVKFVDAIKKGQLNGTRDPHAKLISLAMKSGRTIDGKPQLVFDESILKETASHEAFHVLQDYFIQYDPQAKKILDQEFGATEKVNKKIDYKNTKTAKWLKRANRKLHDDLLAMSATNEGITGREIQAYAFSAYNQARREGKTPVMAGGLARYFRFVSNFLERLGNYTSGLGFANAQDVFEAVSSGTAAKKFNNRSLSEQDADPSQAPDIEQSSRSLNTREYLTSQDGQPYATDTRRSQKLIPINNGSPIIAKVQLRKNEKKRNVVLPQGERKWDTVRQQFTGYGADYVAHPSNINEIRMNTPHREVMPFIQDVVTSGKKVELADGRVQYNYKPESYKQTGVVILEKDRNENLQVSRAFSVDVKKIKLKRSQELAKEAEQRRLREVPEGATQEDIDAYRRGRGTEASARGVAVNAGQSVSTRFPTSKSKDADPLTNILEINSNPIRENPTALKKAARQIKEYNIIRESEVEGLSDNQVLDLYIERTKSNLLFIYNSLSDQIKNRSKLWYEGANNVANRFSTIPSDRYKRNKNLTVEQASGILAALSPQKDWFQNASLAERLIDILSSKQNFEFTPKMGKTAKRIFGKKKYKPMLDEVKGKSLAELEFNTVTEKPYQSTFRAMWVRIYDETYNDRGHRILSPEGKFLDFARKAPTKKQIKNGELGTPKGTGWGSLNEISKAIRMYENEDVSVISTELGKGHKIRSFYNNISNPFDETGSGTIDTHAVAALFFQPFSSTSIPVSHNFGTMATKGVEGAVAVATKGSKGYYGINLEAYAGAAQEVGILPREMQSITWEAIRGLFTPSFKGKKENVAEITKIWNNYKNEAITLDEARQEIINYANSETETESFGRPDWDRPSARSDEVLFDSSYKRELSGVGVPRSDTRDDTRTGGTVTKGTTARPAVDDEYEASSRGVMLSDDEFRNATFKKVIKGNFQASGFTGKGKLLANRNLTRGTQVTLRPNLNGWIKEEGAPILTQTVHDRSKGKYGEVLGYDHTVAAEGKVDLDVNQKARAKIALGEENKFPMAGAIGGYAPLSLEESQNIISNPDHTLKFNPRGYHLFVDQNGFAVKSYNGTGVHQGANVFVKGDIEYWKQLEAPQQERGVETDVKYFDAPDYEASARGYASSWDEVITSKDDNIINNFLTGLKKIYSLKDNFINEFVNSTEPIGRLEEEVSFRLTGVRRRFGVAEGAQRFMEMVMNTAGRVEMIMKHGAPEMRADGTISLQKNTKGLFEIFKDFNIEEYNDFVPYAMARRAKALGEKERFIGPDLIQDGLNRETTKYKNAFDEYQKYNKSLLNFLVQAGVLDERQKNNLAKYDYMPFYRIIEEDTYKAGVMFKSAVAGPNITNVLNDPVKSSLFKEYKGGQKPVGDILENMFRNTQAFVSTAMKNKAMQKAVNLMEQAEVGKRVTNAEASIIKESQGGKVVSFNKNVKLKDGRVVNRKVHYDISEDPHIYASLASMTPRQTAGLFKVMERLGKIFREGITHAPPFMIANLIRGDMAGVVTVDAPLTPMIDTLGGLKNAFQETETIKEMKLIAGVGGYAMGDDYRDSANALKRQMRMRHQGYKVVTNARGVVDLIQASWGQLTKVGEATELATREAIYRKLVEQGMSKSDAAYEALNVINFNRRGASQTNVGLFINSLLPLVPFLNARFQGLYRTFEPMVSGKQADRGKTIGKGLILMGANMALYSLMSQDDRWREEPMHRKLAYHIIYPNMLGMEDILGAEPILIPRAFEIGAIFTSIPELFVDGVTRENGDYVADGLKHTFINTFQFNPIPQALIPAIEVVSNYDFFSGREVDTASQRRYLPSERVGPTTPEAARLLSKASQETLSPNQISQLIEGYLGTLGGYMLTAFDVGASSMGVIPNRPTGVFGDSPPAKVIEALGFGRFRKPVPDPSNRFVGDFYELKKEVDTIYSTVNRLKTDGRLEQARELMEENKGLLRYRGQLNSINKQLQNVNGLIRKVRLDEKMSSNNKESRLKVLISRRNKAARRVDKILEKIRES